MLIEAVRWFIVGTSVLVAIIGAPVLWRRWPGYRIENKYVWIAVIVANFALGYGTAETLWRGIPGGPRTLVTAFAEFFFLVAVIYHPLESLRRWWRIRQLLRHQRKERLR